ncbi:MAG TPA: hypothetical protein VNS29_04000 [Burkholderiaceae bacterium]|nr:hypothetical protein [Burkholderiaceae bacterium]
MSKIDPLAQRKAATKRTTGLPTESAYWLTPHGMTGMDSTGKLGSGGEFAKQATHWQSPQTSDMNGARQPDGKRSLGLNTQGTNRTTPTASERSGQGERNKALRLDVQQWASPRASDGEKGGPNQRGSKGDLMLPSMAAQWPTPDAAMHQGSNTTPGSLVARPNISLAAATWPTPAARDGKGTNSQEHCTVTGGGRKHMDQLANFVAHSDSLRPVHSAIDGRELSPTGRTLPRRLNPAFACWLMGWPIWWTNPALTSCAKSEMESYRCALRSHLSSLCGDQASELNRKSA